jgi:hypothetical protein
MGIHYQIVNVLDAVHLIDCESYQRRYRTRDAQPLAPGHYVVLWEETAEQRHFDEQATYVGPYKSSWHAKAALVNFLRSQPARATPASREAA